MRIKASVARVFVIFLSIIIVPSLVYVSLSASSMAAGILVACLIIAFAAGRLRLPIGFIKLPVLFFFSVFFVHAIYYGARGSLSLKHILSVILLGFMFFCAGMLAIQIRRVRDIELIGVIKIISLIVVVLAWWAIFLPVSILNYDAYAKSIFPFAEPSHYAITVSGVLLATGFYLTSLMRAVLVLTMLLFSVLYPSTLLLLLALIMLFSYYMHGFLKLGFVFILLAIVVFIIPYAGIDVSYFEDRLTFDDSTSNLTALVYMQGWEDAYSSLLHTNWVGLGFQNMGSLEPGYFGQRIYEIVDRYMNREDGGFLAAKIVGEFGALGVLFLFFYIVALITSIIYNRKFFKSYQMDRDKALELFPVSSVLGCSLIVAFSIEVFARGYGYFSPGILLAMVAIFLVGKKRKKCSADYSVNYA